MKTKSQRIKELEEENKNLKEQIHDLNFNLMITRTRRQMEISNLHHRLINSITNPQIKLPGNETIFYRDLNDVQLSYLKSLNNTDDKKENTI